MIEHQHRPAPRGPALALLGGLPLLIVYVLFQRQVICGVGSAGRND